MLSRLGIIYKVLWKQYFYKHYRWFVLLLATALVMRISQIQKLPEEMNGIMVGVCAKDADGERLLKQLQQPDQIFHFCSYEETEAMLRDVKNGTLECAYLLPEDFFKQISDGKMRKQITLYHSASSGAHKLSYEVVFSHLFAMLSEEILEDWYVEGAGEVAEAEECLLERKEAYEAGDATFTFAFEYVGEQAGMEAPILSKERGFAGVSVFFLALLGLANCREIAGKAGAYARRDARRMEGFCLHIAVLGSVLAGGAFLLLADGFEQPAKELGGLVIYWIILEIYLRILGCILKTSRAVYGAIPVLLLGSILLCPVFFRLETWIPVAGYLGKLFPPYWYLNIFI